MVQERNWIECNRVPEAQPLSFLVLGLVEHIFLDYNHQYNAEVYHK